MILRILLAALFALTAGSAAAQDRLVPVARTDAVSKQYQDNVRAVFGEAFAADVQARMLFLPSFEPEEAIGLRKRNGGYELFALAATQQIWGYSLMDMMRSGQIAVSSSNGEDGAPAAIARIRQSLPAHPEDLPLQRCTVALGAAPANAILTAWRTMLDQVRPTDGPALGIDGESYIFAMPGPGGERSGEAFSPGKGSRVYRLTALAAAMRSYCRTPHERALRALVALAEKVAR